MRVVTGDLVLVLTGSRPDSGLGFPRQIAEVDAYNAVGATDIVVPSLRAEGPHPAISRTKEIAEWEECAAFLAGVLSYVAKIGRHALRPRTFRMSSCSAW